jgi:hypothetical protein
MKLSFGTGLMIAIVVFAVFPARSSASQVVVGNLGSSPDPTSPAVIDSSDYWAQEFTTGGMSYTLQNILASLGEANGSLSLTAQLIEVPSADVAPDSGTVVDTLIQNGSVPSSGFANVEFDPSKTDTLDPTKFYWFVLSGSSPNDSDNVAWQFTGSTTVDGPGTLPNYASFATGFGWLVLPAAVPGAPNEPQLIQVNALGQAPAPEPSTVVLGLFGFSTVFVARLLRKKARRRA